MNYTIICLKDDGLDLSYYVSMPRMFNNLPYKQVKLKLMIYMDKYLIVENGICKEITIANYQYAKANNPQYSDYNSSKLKF
jgi:hypothetical protein